jgi:ABC-2 type transport system permease protein
VKALTIANNELKRFLRDRTALFFTVALPVVLIVIVGTATSGFDDDVATIGIVRTGDGPLATELTDALARHEQIKLETYDDRTALAKDVRRSAVPAGIVIPEDYDSELASSKPADVELLIDQTRGSPAAVRSIIAEVLADQGAALQAAIFTSRQARVDIDDALVRARRTAASLENSVGIEAETVGRSEGNDYLAPGIGYQAPSNLILFVFITSLAGSALIIQSRQLRVMQRMYATPTSTGSILFGEGLARFSIAGFQALFIFMVGAFVFDVDWGQPIGAAALIVLFVLVGTSVGILFGTIFSTPDQAGTIGSMSGIAMGMLGGCMWPLEIVPEPMRVAGHIFPHAWAMDAWIELIGRGGTIADITTELAVLAGFVAVLLPLGTWRLRRALVG